LTRHQWIVLGLCSAAVLASSFDGAVLFLALPAVSSQFRASFASLADLGSLLAVGSLGALPLGALADQSGRRRLIAVGVAGFSLANVISGFATGLTALGAARVLAVCFEAAVASIATVLVVEEVPSGRRGLAVSVLTIAAGAGTFVTTVAYPLVAPNWRLLYWAGGLGLPVAAALWWLLPEGRTWSAAPRERAVEALGLLWSAPWRRRLMTLAGWSLLSAVLLEPAGLFVAFYGSRTLGFPPLEISAVVWAAGIAGVLCYPLGGWLSDRLGRRWLGSGLAAGTSVFAGGAFVSGVAGYWAGNIAWSAFASADTPVLGAWFAEVFPTRARATGDAVASVAGAAGGVGGLQLAALLEPHLGIGPALALTAPMAFLGALILLALPETRGTPLPD
jgi:MFS transporter, AAHS family, benzoate transport protein